MTKVDISGNTNVVDDFLAKVRGNPSGEASHRGRLVFALDATGSRKSTWDMACRLQGDMFREVAKIGGLDIQLIYYRDLDECRVSKWISDTRQLTAAMTKIDCRSGPTQIGKVINHVRHESRIAPVHAVVLVSDAMEEVHGDLCDAASGLGTPLFMFQEGNDDDVEMTFKEIARLTKGAYCSFDAGAAAQLGELLRAVAVFATGGVQALADLRGNRSAAKLLSQMRG